MEHRSKGIGMRPRFKTEAPDGEGARTPLHVSQR